MILTGAMAFKRTPLGAHSIASDFVKFSTPALAAPDGLSETIEVSC